MFEVIAEDITKLDAEQATQLLDQLLHLEAATARIPLGNVKVSLKRHTADGGEDGSIQWETGAHCTDYLPKRYVLFQVKATAQSDSMSPAACANEIASEDKTQTNSSRQVGSRKKILIRKMKPAVEQALDKDACYVLFCTEKFGPAEQARRIEAMRRAIQQSGKPYHATVRLEIYDAQRIAKWTNKYIAAVTQVMGWAGKTLPTDVMPWSLWSKDSELKRFQYVASTSNQQHIRRIREHLSGKGKQLRIVGLPGLGKTRLVMEACRAQGDSPENKFLSGSIAYIDMDQLTSDRLIEFLGVLIRKNIKGILIIDNCSLALYKHCVKKNRNADNLKLVTLNYDPSNVEATDVIHVTPEEDHVIRKMLEQAYPKLPMKDLARIVTFAQGFPQMAVLMADAHLESKDNLAELSDEDLLRRLIWKRSQFDIIGHSVLQFCSLFIEIGWKGKLQAEYECIARHIGVHSMIVYSYLQRFQLPEPNILQEQHDNYLQVVPKPLAIRLAADWFRKNDPQKIIAFITSMSAGMRERFAHQFSLIHYLPEAQQFINELSQPEELFSNINLLLTKDGAQLISSAAEVNGKAVIGSLSNMFGSLTNLPPLPVACLDILIHTLEKLCFPRENFHAAWPILLKLCLLLSAGPEKDLAARYFTRLFQVTESGTQADLDERQKALALLMKQGKGEIEAELLLTQALGNALAIHNRPRSPRAEYQGSGKALEDWKPTVDTEHKVLMYRQNAVQLLVNLAGDTTDVGLAAYQQIKKHLKTLMLTELFDPIIKLPNLAGLHHDDKGLSKRIAEVLTEESLSEKATNLLQDWQSRLKSSSTTVATIAATFFTSSTLATATEELSSSTSKRPREDDDAHAGKVARRRTDI